MRRIAFVTAVVACAVAATPAMAASKDGKATGGIKHVTVAGFDGQADFNAQGTPADAKGRVHRRVVDNGGLIREFTGDVTCYFQVGNLARFSGVITNEQGDDSIQGQYFLWAVQDNGEGSKAPPDLFSAARSATPFDCATFAQMPFLPVDNGNIQVH